ncbi:hypothetical protein Tco_0287228 [Tanacetum coccineum]
MVTIVNLLRGGGDVVSQFWSLWGFVLGWKVLWEWVVDFEEEEKDSNGLLVFDELCKNDAKCNKTDLRVREMDDNSNSEEVEKESIESVGSLKVKKIRNRYGLGIGGYGDSLFPILGLDGLGGHDGGDKMATLMLKHNIATGVIHYPSG